ncbi:cation diffusion facilitator family transporter [Radiobacillus sp. PE A8.2]|uniref:cation diffusion facilitator family transporter n=1 Tax=Radiobacillus sp. PE A8.2 TaxID=3380349 RepID=UPI00388DE652
MEQYENLQKGEKGAWISISAYLILALTKLIIAYFGDSAALRADGLNNTTDVVASVAVLVGLRISRKPPDDDHHYGHFRAETIASLIAAFIMVTVGFQVIFGTVRSLFLHESISNPSWLTAWTALGAAIVMLFVYHYNKQLAKQIKSSSLHAAAQDNKSDALVSMGAFIGIVGSQFGLYWLDPIAALAVGLIICKTAWEIFRDATHTLTDGFDESKLTIIKDSIAKDPEVEEVKDVKGRIHGNQTLIEATIYVDPELTVAQSHKITDRIEHILDEKHDIPHAHIHIEPFPEEIENK